VVTVKMRDADLGDVSRRDPGVDQLSLRALTRIEQQALAVPTQQVAVVIAIARGHLAGGTEHDELTD
jgi:hypothetical protein